MKKPKKLILKSETLKALDPNRNTAIQGGALSSITTTIFSEGACETFPWLRACH